MTAPQGFAADGNPPYGDDRGQHDALNEALRDLLEAARRVQRMTGAHISVDLHKLSEADFYAADFISSDWEAEEREAGDPKYGHVKGQEHAYLSRLLYRGDGVLYQLFASVAPRTESGQRSWRFV